MHELATPVKLSLPIAVALWNNDDFGKIAEGMNERGVPRIGVRPRNPDFINLAETFRCYAAGPVEVWEDAVFLGG